jgi:hypothetical protein
MKAADYSETSLSFCQTAVHRLQYSKQYDTLSALLETQNSLLCAFLLPPVLATSRRLLYLNKLGDLYRTKLLIVFRDQQTEGWDASCRMSSSLYKKKLYLVPTVTCGKPTYQGFVLKAAACCSGYLPYVPCVPSIPTLRMVSDCCRTW